MTSLHTVGPSIAGGQRYDYNTILEAAESAYVTLGTKWNVPNNSTKSSFVSRKNVVCWGCGESGHTLDNCPKTSDANKKKIFEEKRNNKNGGNGNGKNKSDSGDNAELSITKQVKIPPKQGEKQTKVIGGKTRYWCSKCKRWTISHGTAQHKAKNSGSDGNEETPTDEEPTSQLTFAQQISQQLRNSSE